MKPLKKDDLEQALQRLRSKYNPEMLRKIKKFEKLSKEQLAEMLIFVESISLLILDSYIRNNKSLP